MAANLYTAIIDPDEAIRNATEMGKTSEELSDLFKAVKDQVYQIDDEEYKMYFGDGKSSNAEEFRAELDDISSNFVLLTDQVDKHASEIIEIATKMKEE